MKSKKTAVKKIPKKKVIYQLPFHKKYEHSIQLALVPLILLAIFFIIVLANLRLQSHIDRQTFKAIPTAYEVNEYPYLNKLPSLSVSARSAIILDDQTQTVIYARNANLRFSMASTTKLMTATVGLEHFLLSDILTIFNPNIEGAKVGFAYGEQLTFENLLYGMLLPSGNDAAYAIADNYPGGKNVFIEKMNEKAQQLHLSNTHYADPAGLTDNEDYTTVVDLAHLGSYVIHNPVLAKIVNTKAKIISTTSGRLIELRNLNELLGSDGVTGLKTGFTEGAGGVLVTSKVANGRTFIIVVMKSDDRFADTKALLQLVDSGISYFQPAFGISF
jgi:D-alanyl-D-alanine carboxypeptidase (penicillin-binding protein 5/6)